MFVDHSLQKLLYDEAKKTLSKDALNELFQFPRSKNRMYGIIRHQKGHVNHFHVRFHE